MLFTWKMNSMSRKSSNIYIVAWWLYTVFGIPIMYDFESAGNTETGITGKSKPHEWHLVHNHRNANHRNLCATNIWKEWSTFGIENWSLPLKQQYKIIQINYRFHRSLKDAMVPDLWTRRLYTVTWRQLQFQIIPIYNLWHSYRIHIAFQIVHIFF